MTPCSPTCQSQCQTTCRWRRVWRGTCRRSAGTSGPPPVPAASRHGMAWVVPAHQSSRHVSYQHISRHGMGRASTSVITARDVPAHQSSRHVSCQYISHHGMCRASTSVITAWVMPAHQSSRHGSCQHIFHEENRASALSQCVQLVSIGTQRIHTGYSFPVCPISKHKRLEQTLNMPKFTENFPILFSCRESRESRI